MAFCAVTEASREKLNLLVKVTVLDNPAALKNFKDFTQGIVQTLINKGVPVEKAITLAKNIPQAITGFTVDRANRDLLKKAGVSFDAIRDVEDQFDNYDTLAKFAGIKNEPLSVVVVNSQQVEMQSKITQHIADTTVEFDSNKARTINGTKFNNRVTDIAKVGFVDKEQDNKATPIAETPALKHGNTVDAIAKAVFDELNPKFEDFEHLIESSAFDALVANLRTVKKALESQGFIFKTGVTVYNKALSVSGEIDLVAINPKGEAYILDFKTSRARFNETYLKNETLKYKSEGMEVSILSKWKQYGTQGYIYSKMLEDQLGIPAVNKVGIIGINLVYDASLPLETTKITKVVGAEMHNIPFTDVRTEFKGKNMPDILTEFKRLENQSIGPVEEIKQRKPIPTRKNRKELDRVAIINEAAAKDSELKEEVDWFRNNPIGQDTLLRLSNLVNAGRLGYWTLDGITLFKNASVGTLYHEGWHRFSQVFMSPEQKTELYNSIKKDGLKYRTRDGRTINTSTAEFLDIEEFLADEFAKYALNPTAYKYPAKNEGPKNLFQKIWDFLKRFFGVNPRAVEVFQKLYTGKTAEYIPSVNNAFWGNLNSLVENKQGEEIISNERFPLYRDSIDYLIGKLLREKSKSFTAFKQSKALQAAVIDNLYDELALIHNNPKTTDEQAAEIQSIIDNLNDYMRVHLTATSFQTLKDFIIDDEVYNMSTDEQAALEDIRDEYGESDDIDLDEDASSSELFTPNANETSAFSLADDAIADFFRTIPKSKGFDKDGKQIHELNELGIPQNHTYYDVFYRTKRMMSKARTMDDMIEILNDKNNHRLFPELAIIRDYIAPFLFSGTSDKNFLRNIQNVQFVQAFWHTLTMPEVPNMQLKVDYVNAGKPKKTQLSTLVSFRTASRNLSLKIVKTWEKNFKDRRGKKFLDMENWEGSKKNAINEPLYLTEDGKLLLNPFVDYATRYPSTTAGVKAFWGVMGVTFNEKVFQDPDAVRQLIDVKNILTKNISLYKNSIEDEFIDKSREAFELLDIEDEITVPEILSSMPSLMIDDYSKQYFIGNPVSFFNEKKLLKYQVITKDNRAVNTEQTTEGLRFKFEDMAALEELYGDRVSSGSFRIEDKTKYPYYVLSHILDVTRRLNGLEDTGDFVNTLELANLDPNKNPWMKRSYFMKRMFNSNGTRQLDAKGKPITINVLDIASFAARREGGTEEKAPSSLLKDEKFALDVLTLFRGGAIEIPRSETSSTTFAIRLTDYGKGKELPITISEGTSRDGSMVPETFQAIVKDYFAAEIEKRQWWIKNDPKVVGANKKPLASQFNVFEGILSKELKDKVVANLDKTPEEIFAIEGVEADFRKEIEEYFKQRINETRPKFDDSKIGLSPEQKVLLADVIGPNTKMLSAARAFVLNQFILSQEFYNLYFGDLYFYKSAFKRGKYVTNTGNAFSIDDYRNEMLNGIQNSTMHSAITGKKPGGRDFRYLNTAIMEDVEMQSYYVNDDDSKNRMLQDILNMRVARGSLTRNSPEYNQFVEDTKKSLTKYKSINIADGQGIISLDFYRNFSIITNIWDENKEREYERQKAIFRDHTNSYFKLDNEGNKVAMEGEELESARKADRTLRAEKPKAYFNPLKVSYTGPQAKAGPIRPVFDKFSVRPIIPEMAIGKRDENLMKEMATKDIDYVKFKSGTKVYQDSTFEWYNKVADGQYDLADFSVDEIAPNQLYSSYLKHQLSTEGFKEENIFGSQFRKIIFGVKYSPLVKNNPTLFNKFKKLEDRFIGKINDLLQIEENDLFTLLGIDKRGNNYQVTDMSRFIQLLQTESVKRGVAVNNIDYLKYNPATGTAEYPIDYAFNRQQIQDLLSGLMDERLRRLKVNGSALIQVSSAGNESMPETGRFKTATQEELDLYGTTGLHYYHVIYDNAGNPVGTSTMGVKVAMIGEYKNLFKLQAPVSIEIPDKYKRFGREVLEKVTDASGEPAIVPGRIKEAGMSDEQALKRLNQALKDPEWRKLHKDVLTLVGYRIPTQGVNFTDHMEIMEFLPEAAGAILIPPIEAIIKSGSDFDIDKINVIRPSISDNGGVVRAPSSKILENGTKITVTDTLDTITSEIRSQTFQERDIKKIKKQLKDFTAGAAFEIADLEVMQRTIRLTMLDLAQKAAASTLVDVVMDNLAQGRPYVTPNEEQIEELKKQYPDDEIQEGETIEQAVYELERVTAQFDELDKRLTALIEKQKGFRTEISKIDADQMKWFNKKKQYKKSLNNDIIDILSQTMSNPEYFELLVTPSSSAMFDGLTNELMASQANMTPQEFAIAMQETGNKLYDRSLTPQQTSTYEATLEAFDNLQSKRKDLGGYAIQRTFADVFNFVNLSFAKEYTVPIGRSKYETKVIHTPLISPSDRSKVVVNGRILMHGDSISGIPISKSFDELISLTVDLANSPAYPKMNITKFNRKYMQYLLHQKADPKAVLWFLNQPVLNELFKLYEEKRRKVKGYTLKHAIVEKSLQMRILKNENLYPTGNKMKYEVYGTRIIEEEVDPVDPDEVLEPAQRVTDYTTANKWLSRPYYDLNAQNMTEPDYFSIEEMDKAIRNKDNNSEFQKKVLAYFASITEESDWLMKLQFANNVDTTKYATLTSLIRNEVNRREIHNSDLFLDSQINMMENSSMITPFDYTQKAKSILKALFPKLYTDATINSFTNLVTDVFGAKNSQIDRISKIIENDFIEYIYKNYGRYNGKDLSDYFQPQLVNLDNVKDHQFFSYRLNSIKAKYPELQELPFVDRLSEDSYFPPDFDQENSFKGLDNKEIHNIFLLRNPDNPTFEKNVFTNNWRNLINFDAEKLGLKAQYDDNAIAEISQFFHELIYFSLYQSGLTNTGNGFSDLIPYENWAVFIEQAFTEYERAKSDNSSLELEMLREFEYRARQMNPKVPWKTQSRQLQETNDEGQAMKKDLEFYRNYYRGKDYKITADDIKMSRETFLTADDEAEDSRRPKGPAKQANSGPFQAGTHVFYQGEEFILVRRFPTGAWQLYNPQRQGVTARTSARESKMTTLNKASNIVQYGQKFYIVTPEKEIVDIDRSLKLSLSATDYNRINILKLAEDQNKPKEPPINPVDPIIDPSCD